jgi:peroxiredoxin
MAFTLEIGEKAIDFNLPATEGKNQSHWLQREMGRQRQTPDAGGGL